MHTKFLSRSLKRRHNLRDLDVDDRIILKCILNRVTGCELDSSGLG
jgi:hypothetical protein